ncbi:MAG: DUF192 domain-containing protein [Candidatus Omnitrophica bacterium]|nr:DUF192 domain-containing protein [Candidatus Omnitrophota bacterium]MDD5671916.1 DUF192 domain-containing protein [Candidatus Omnitrophota bacterium]
MKLVNITQGQTLSHRVRVAQSIWQRMRGLIGTKTMADDEVFWIPQCQGVHTFAMVFPIDVVFLDGQGTVLKIDPGMLPNRIGPVCWKARSVLELPGGAAKRYKLGIGNKLCWQE